MIKYLEPSHLMAMWVLPDALDLIEEHGYRWLEIKEFVSTHNPKWQKYFSTRKLLLVRTARILRRLVAKARRRLKAGSSSLHKAEQV